MTIQKFIDEAEKINIVYDGRFDTQRKTLLHKSLACLEILNGACRYYAELKHIPEQFREKFQEILGQGNTAHEALQQCERILGNTK